MKALILARHAHAASNDNDVTSSVPPGAGLSGLGVEQARALAGSLVDVGVDLGVATELERTRETLGLALAGRAVPRETLPALNEIRFGDFEGAPLAAYRSWAWTAPPEERCPGGGESRAEAAARIASGLRDVLRRESATILVVGHALPVRYVLDAAEGLVPAARVTPVPHAVAHLLAADAVERAAALLEGWSVDPRFR